MSGEIKDFVTIGALIFGSGGLWQLVRTLKENLKELKMNGAKIQEIVTDHETRITVLEIPKPKRR